MAVPRDIPIETLRSILRLDPLTGKLYWLARPRAMFSDDRIWAGTEALASPHAGGYLCGAIFGRGYLAHGSGAKRVIGYFVDEIEAAKAYDDFVAKEHGDFARLNFPGKAA